MMDRMRYTASARLGVWDTVGTNTQELLEKLKQLLQENSNGLIETETLELRAGDDAGRAAVIAICDKVAGRGNPTLIDPLFEAAVMAGPAMDPAFSPSEIIEAARELFSLPYDYDPDDPPFRCALPADLQGLCSPEEDLFEAGFRQNFGARCAIRLQRQVLIPELAGNCGPHLANSRVDFVLHAGCLRWVFEVDGEQHAAPVQAANDRARDQALIAKGWSVFRVPASDARLQMAAWAKQFVERLPENELAQLKQLQARCVRDAIAKSAVHRMALKYIIEPTAVQRCLRGIIRLFANGVLAAHGSPVILVIEEDLGVTATAVSMLLTMWQHLHVLAPQTPAPPQIVLDVIGGEAPPENALHGNLAVRQPSVPEGPYDIIMSHGFFAEAGCRGRVEQRLFPIRPANFVSLRKAIGAVTERALQWCQALDYDLENLENALAVREGEEPREIPVLQSDALQYFLRLVFRKQEFWDGQLRVVARLLQRKPAVVLLPTGGGKSLTYQLSGLLLPGMTIVIDPLVSLMADQVENLTVAGIDMVNYVSGPQEREEKEAVMADMEAGRLAFIFVAPERLQMKEFRDRLRSVVARFPVSLAVIDEAHCVSEWGHSFRPAYLHLARNLEKYCSDDGALVPTLVGLTGTASFAVLTDIQMEMRITDEIAVILPKSFDRKELRFLVRKVPMRGKLAELKSFRNVRLPQMLGGNEQTFYLLRGPRTNSGIVFCPHVNGSLGIVSVAGTLGHDNIFGGSTPKTFERDTHRWNLHKRRVQQEFKRNLVQELVATKSFGMGIDKPNIRYTIHYAVPESVEAFYQEAGRAGRNGIANYALCTIIYSDDNWETAIQILDEPDHVAGAARLKAVAWNDLGDLLHQLWFLFNTYRGHEQEKRDTMDFWRTNVAPRLRGLPLGATTSVGVSFRSDAERETLERSIFRLMLLGVVQDYTINWGAKGIEAFVENRSPDQIRGSLEQYLRQYKFKEFAETAVRAVPVATIEAALGEGIGVLVDFVYGHIVAKRKQALRTMGELCRNFESDAEFREALLNYLQESEFSETLRTWMRLSFDAIGLESIHALMDELTELEQVKRLVGTARRMLDEDPGNNAFRYLSLLARAGSAAESDSSVLQEARSLASQVDRGRELFADADASLFAMVEMVMKRRPAVAARVGDTFMRSAGTPGLARLVLAAPGPVRELLLEQCAVLLLAGVVAALRDCEFY